MAALAPHEPGTSFAGLYTAYISSAPRKFDDGVCAHSLLNAIHQTRALLPGATVVVVFDGRSPRASDTLWWRFTRKKQIVREAFGAMPDVRIIESPRWLHQAVGLRNAMNETSGTRLVYVMQDDVTLVPQINVSAITHRLLHDEKVRYVKLFNYDRVAPRLQKYSQPGTPHPSDPALYKLLRYSDRPHFATRELYSADIWPLLLDSYRIVPEDLQEHIVGRRRQYFRGIWLYAPRGATKHETHSECGRLSTTVRANPYGKIVDGIRPDR